MKELFTLWIFAVLIQQVVPGTLVRLPRMLKSTVHTEYEAKYEQKGKHGNESSSMVKGNQEFIHNNCNDNWNTFAEKCANLVKDLIASLGNTVTSRPGDATNLHLNIKNSFKHFDQTHNCTGIQPVSNCLSNLNLSSLFDKAQLLKSDQPEHHGEHKDFALESWQTKPVPILPEHSGVLPETENHSGDYETNNDRREVENPLKDNEIDKCSGKGEQKEEFPSFSPRNPEGFLGHPTYIQTNSPHPTDNSLIEISAASHNPPFQVKQSPRIDTTESEFPTNGEKPIGHQLATPFAPVPEEEDDKSPLDVPKPSLKEKSSHDDHSQPSLVLIKPVKEPETFHTELHNKEVEKHYEPEPVVKPALIIVPVEHEIKPDKAEHDDVKPEVHFHEPIEEHNAHHHLIEKKEEYEETVLQSPPIVFPVVPLESDSHLAEGHKDSEPEKHDPKNDHVSEPADHLQSKLDKLAHPENCDDESDEHKSHDRHKKHDDKHEEKKHDLKNLEHIEKKLDKILHNDHKKHKHKHDDASEAAEHIQSKLDKFVSHEDYDGKSHEKPKKDYHKHDDVSDLAEHLQLKLDKLGHPEDCDDNKHNHLDKHDLKKLEKIEKKLDKLHKKEEKMQKHELKKLEPIEKKLDKIIRDEHEHDKKHEHKKHEDDKKHEHKESNDGKKHEHEESDDDKKHKHDDASGVADHIHSKLDKLVSHEDYEDKDDHKSHDEHKHLDKHDLKKLEKIEKKLDKLHEKEEKKQKHELKKLEHIEKKLDKILSDDHKKDDHEKDDYKKDHVLEVAENIQLKLDKLISHEDNDDDKNDHKSHDEHKHLDKHDLKKLEKIEKKLDKLHKKEEKKKKHELKKLEHIEKKLDKIVPDEHDHDKKNKHKHKHDDVSQVAEHIQSKLDHLVSREDYDDKDHKHKTHDDHEGHNHESHNQPEKREHKTHEEPKEHEHKIYEEPKEHDYLKEHEHTIYEPPKEHKIYEDPKEHDHKSHDPPKEHEHKIYEEPKEHDHPKEHEHKIYEPPKEHKIHEDPEEHKHKIHEDPEEHKHKIHEDPEEHEHKIHEDPEEHEHKFHDHPEEPKEKAKPIELMPLESVEPIPIPSIAPPEDPEYRDSSNIEAPEIVHQDPQKPFYPEIPLIHRTISEHHEEPTTFQTTSVDPTSPDIYSHVPPPSLTKPLSHTLAPYSHHDEDYHIRPSASPSLIFSQKKTNHEEDEEDEEEEDEDCCSCESCTEEPITDIKEYQISACRDLEEARRELKAIFDKIKKKLKCGRKCGINTPR